MGFSQAPRLDDIVFFGQICVCDRRIVTIDGKVGFINGKLNHRMFYYMLQRNGPCQNGRMGTAFEVNFLLQASFIQCRIFQNSISMTNTFGMKDIQGLKCFDIFTLTKTMHIWFTSFTLLAGAASPAWTVLWIPNFLASVNAAISLSTEPMDFQ